MKHTIQHLMVPVLFATLMIGCASAPSNSDQYTENGYEYAHQYWLPDHLPEGGTFYEVSREDGQWSVVGSDSEPIKRREDSELVYVTEDHIQPFYGWTKPMFGREERRDVAYVFICDWDVPTDRYNPCDSKLAENHPMPWSGITYTSEDGSSNINNDTAHFLQLDDEALSRVRAAIKG